MSNKLPKVGIVLAIVCIIIAIVGYIIVRRAAPEGDNVLLPFIGKAAMIIISINLIFVALCIYTLKRNRL